MISINFLRDKKLQNSEEINQDWKREFATKKDALTHYKTILNT